MLLLVKRVVRPVKGGEVHLEGVNLIIPDQSLQCIANVTTPHVGPRVDTERTKTGIKGRLSLGILQQTVRERAVVDTGSGMTLRGSHPEAHGIALIVNPRDQAGEIGKADGVRLPVAEFSVAGPPVVDADAAEAITVAFPSLDHRDDPLLGNSLVEKPPRVDFRKLETQITHVAPLVQASALQLKPDGVTTGHPNRQCSVLGPDLAIPPEACRPSETFQCRPPSGWKVEG